MKSTTCWAVLALHNLCIASTYNADATSFVQRELASVSNATKLYQSTISGNNTKTSGNTTRTEFKQGAETQTDTCIYMADAGSSGTKLFVQHPTAGTIDRKILSKCAGCEHMGVAALACTTTEKACSITVEGGRVTPNLTPTELAAKLADELLIEVDDMRTTQGCKDLGPLVPIMATAGMRLLTAAQQNTIWSKICNASGGPNNGTRFWPRAEKVLAGVKNVNMCGTIPGTAEAFFEYVADWEKAYTDTQNDASCKVSLTMGGASAQMAVKMTDEQYTNFISTVVPKLDRYLKYNASGRFIKILDDTSELGAGFGKILLVSFLGKGEIIRSDQSLLTIATAGGVNTIQQRVEGSKINLTNYTGNIAALERWLNPTSAVGDTNFEGDRWWQVITDSVMPMFAKSASSVVFNTKALHDDKILLDDEWQEYCNVTAAEVDGMSTAQLTTLVKTKLLGEVCKANGNIRFGYKKDNSCYKVWWAEHFKEKLGVASLADNKQMTSDEADWSKGVLFLLRKADKSKNA